MTSSQKRLAGVSATPRYKIAASSFAFCYYKEYARNIRQCSSYSLLALPRAIYISNNWHVFNKSYLAAGRLAGWLACQALQSTSKLAPDICWIVFLRSLQLPFIFCLCSKFSCVHSSQLSSTAY